MARFDLDLDLDETLTLCFLKETSYKKHFSQKFGNYPTYIKEAEKLL